MIYLDNAATSYYKPQSAIDSLIFDITHSANSGRSGHDLSIDATLRIENCRDYLRHIFNADDEYSVIFTKSCTEALNLAIVGFIKPNTRVFTSCSEHNSVLRPLYQLYKKGVISLNIVDIDCNHRLQYNLLNSIVKKNDVLIFGGASNVTGTIVDIDKLSYIANTKGATLIIDGAQCVPYIDIDMNRQNISMLACPAHKGLHGVQGVGFLLVKNDVKLTPLIYGGTGTFSESIDCPITIPDSFEAGTQFSGGICALHQGAKWTFENIKENNQNILSLTSKLHQGLKDIGCTVYSNDCNVGIVAFNYKDIDSSLISDRLNNKQIFVRSGLHCAPLMHKHLNTLSQGVVRMSVGVDTKQQDIDTAINAVEDIIKEL